MIHVEAKAVLAQAEEEPGAVPQRIEEAMKEDITGQRIKRTIDLVNLMEERLRKTLLSFGIRVAAKSKNPDTSGDELEDAVEKKLSDLSGPQRPGEGLNQADIDKLLASM